jgi:glutamyl-Q tRNA(Asp) synthetase
LHAGSLVAALASWLDARAHNGHWFIRIEDIDAPRCVAGADQHILEKLAACGLVADSEPTWQSHRTHLYVTALTQLIDKGWAYPCGCSRKEIEDVYVLQGQDLARHSATVYPGTCREGLNGKPARAWRLNVQAVIDALHLPQTLEWHDRRMGRQQQDVANEVGDFVLKRADGLWAYQLAVVVDDADQRVTHVVRGEDLHDNTARQILLQKALGLLTPIYLHTPLVLGENGEKLSKQNGAQALDLQDPLTALNRAAAVLGLEACGGSVGEALTRWVEFLQNP